MKTTQDFDLLLVGGGLQSALIALAVFDRTPGARVAIVEASEEIGGNHTWCFHRADVPASARAWLDPLVVRRWPAWEVRFPGLRQTFDSEYAAISARRLRRVVETAFAGRAGCALRTRACAVALDGRSVTLGSGERLRAGRVVDARGPSLERAADAPCGWQKFVGLELALDAPAPFLNPIVMDACVEQLDGFRFLYALPFSPTRVLLEETHFSDGPGLDDEALATRALESAARMGLRVRAVLRRERGVLPLPLRWRALGPAARSAGGPEQPLVAGYRGGFFHPTTGYSFPLAVRVAGLLAAHLHGEQLPAAWSTMALEQDQQARFAVLLNRLLFRATEPGQRRAVLERFHRLPLETILGFYALRTRAADRARILCGRPPRGVSLGRALRELVAA